MVGGGDCVGDCAVAVGLVVGGICSAEGVGGGVDCAVGVVLVIGGIAVLE